MKKKHAAGIGSLVALVALVGCQPPPVEAQFRKAEARQYQLLMDYAAKGMFGKPLPRVSAADYMHPSYTTTERARIEGAIKKGFEDGARVVFEKWVSWKSADIEKRVLALVDAASRDAATNGFAQCSAKFESAREIAWQDCVGANLDGKPLPKIDAAVRKSANELLDTKVNPVQWPIIERQMRELMMSYCVDGKFDEGIQAIKDFDLIRVYTSRLDGKLDAVMAELVRLGLPKSRLDPLTRLARKLMSEAANIVDLSDEVAQEETSVCLSEGSNPATERYRQLLKEYRDALVLYDCTPENADRITKELSARVDALVAALRKDPRYGKKFLEHIKRLGASAINKRIVALKTELAAEIDARRAEYVAALSPITELQAKGDLRAAQELAAKSLLKLDKNSKEAKFLRPLLINFITTKVNPELWASMEKEILAKTEEFVGKRAVVEGVAWLYSYPEVRTYAEEIDQRYADVKAEAVALGVPEPVAEQLIASVRESTRDKEHLANHDDYVVDRVTPGKPLTDKQLAKYEKALVACRKALVDNDCTEENADKLVNEIRGLFQPEFDKIGGETHTQVLVLGAHAINKRLAALKDRCVERLIARCTSEAAAAGDFDAARAMVRDIALTGSAAFDARVYALRVGCLNAIVNPLQLVASLGEIEAKRQAFVKAGDFRGLRDWYRNHPGVHDVYAQIDAALEDIRKAAVGIKVDEKDAAEYAAKLKAKLNDIVLEPRPGGYVPPEANPDLSEVKAGAARLQQALLAQYYKPDFVAKACASVPEQVLGMLRKARPESLTTWELNERLRARMAEILAELDIDAMIARQEYLELLAAMDGEFSYDAQVAMAEDAIAKQLGVKCPKSHLLANALLGEYARAMRLLKLRNKLTPEQLAALVIGSVYLDQPAVFDRAKGLGADVNAVSPRDTLGRTALLFAVQLGRTSFVHKLVAAGAKVDVVDVNGDTAVHYAVRRGNIAVLNAMIAKNDVNARNKAGQTALFDAARQNQAALVEALIAAKADVAVKDGEGRTAFDAACACGSRDVLDALAAAGAAYGPAQLAIAAAGDYLGVAQWLVGHGTDVNGDGVMAAAKCGTDTKRYLVHEGGVPSACDCLVCKPVKVVEKSAEKTAEATGTLNFTVRETK